MKFYGVLLGFFVLFSSTSSYAIRVGIFTGTFDPPHDGHVETIVRAIEHGELDVVYIEATLAAHKPNALPYGVRVEMMEHVFKQVPQVKRVPEAVLKYILQDTNIPALKELLEIHRGDEFFRILGSDKFTSETVLLMEGTGLQYIVNVREASDLDVPYAQDVLKREGTVTLPVATFQVSSTEIRAATKKGYRHNYVDPEIYKRVISLGGYRHPVCKSLL